MVQDKVQSASGSALVIGPIYVDTVFAGLHRLPLPGEEVTASEFGVAPGGYAISALALHRLGVQTTLCGDVGPDLYGSYLTGALKEQGLATTAVFSDAPATNVAVTMNWNGDRGIVSYGHPTMADIRRYEKVLDDQPPGTVVLLSARHPYAPRLLERAKSRSLDVALSLSWHPDFLRSWQLRDLLPSSDLLFCNVPEALMVSQETDVERAGRRLAGSVPEVVITRGPEGADAIHGHHREHVAAVPAVVVDATGAGDVFAASYLAARLWGWDYADRLHAASFCAGRAVEHIGPLGVAVSRDTLERSLGRSPGVAGLDPVLPG